MQEAEELPGPDVFAGKTVPVPESRDLSATGEPDGPEYLRRAYDFMYGQHGPCPEAICRIIFIL